MLGVISNSFYKCHKGDEVFSLFSSLNSNALDFQYSCLFVMIELNLWNKTVNNVNETLSMKGFLSSDHEFRSSVCKA